MLNMWLFAVVSSKIKIAQNRGKPSKQVSHAKQSLASQSKQNKQVKKQAKQIKQARQAQAKPGRVSWRKRASFASQWSNPRQANQVTQVN